MNIKPIKDERDYAHTLCQIENLIDAKPNTSKMDELEVFTTLVEAFEEQQLQARSSRPY
ncbi:hypothetical protein [Sulfurimonas sp.]|jgi:HTH-type transcriptional regulator/antitoxin HigA|uniref:hypothetical protein n=1 Tax=Sulfurimonas sp. TaxID=2022749 RepID=UPI0025F64F7C|nr:hypothetical protein [Sulfurimonas sp.]MBT5935538.1 hypothetical protein [Sulfurimonas sp.]